MMWLEQHKREVISAAGGALLGVLLAWEVELGWGGWWCVLAAAATAVLAVDGLSRLYGNFLRDSMDAVP